MVLPFLIKWKYKKLTHVNYNKVIIVMEPAHVKNYNFCCVPLFLFLSTGDFKCDRTSL